MSNSTSINFTFGDTPPLHASSPTLTVVVGAHSNLQAMDLSSWMSSGSKDESVSARQSIVTTLLNDCKGGKRVTSASTYLEPHHQWIIVTVPETTSRSLHTWSVHALTPTLKSVLSGTRTTRILFGGNDLAPQDGKNSVPSALVVAVAKALAATAYSRKTSDAPKRDARTISMSFLYTTATSVDGTTVVPTVVSVSKLQQQQWLAVCDSIWLTARLVDMPPCELTTTAYAEICAGLVSNVVTMTEIVGDDLRDQGFGGLYSVGMAATCPPRLLVLDYHPQPSYKNAIALVGKGIVYDTGGLSLKSKDGMPGMKMDMGGSAALLGAFVAAVQMYELQRDDATVVVPIPRLVLVLCLAENAIGPTAVRNDDIITMYSGKTVEINNTDAEGRLVLGDGVAYATRHVEHLSLVMDMATLTGAQLVATGRTHAAVLTNDADVEVQAVAAGLASGDVVMPLVYAPELLVSEFESKVADLKNSVKDRGNAQSSCAGHFIEAHLSDDYTGAWCHVDMAGPVEKDGRATGYGVALVLALLHVPGF